jgi:hypothetical protein
MGRPHLHTKHMGEGPRCLPEKRDGMLGKVQIRGGDGSQTVTFVWFDCSMTSLQVVTKWMSRTMVHKWTYRCSALGFKYWLYV